MASTSFLDPVLNPLLQPMLDFSPFLAVLILALVISLLMTLAYKYMTNQEKMKDLKEQQKGYQQSMKNLRDKPEEMMKVQKDAMKVNMEYMKHSFKPTLITFIPIILIFGWMTAHLSYEPIYPGEPYSITAQFDEALLGKNIELLADENTEIISEKIQKIDGPVSWNLRSKTEGEHLLTLKAGSEEQTRKILISKELKYAEAITEFEHSGIKSVAINYNKLRPLGAGFSIFGWQPGWLGLYIIFSIVFSMGLRKILKLY